MYRRLACNIDFVCTRTRVSFHKPTVSIPPFVVSMYTVSRDVYSAMGKFLLQNHSDMIANDSQDVSSSSLDKPTYRSSDYTYSMSEILVWRTGSVAYTVICMSHIPA